MFDATLEATLIVKGPLMTRSSAIGAYGVDAPMAKTVDGSYCFPLELIIGRLKESLRDLAAIDPAGFNPPIDEWFGSPSPDSTVEPARGRLRASDFVTNGKGNGDTLFRIRMDEERGAVDKGAYLVIEAPFAPGEPVTFKGEICFLAETIDEIEAIRAALELGFRWQVSMGAQKSIGYGQLIDATVEEKESADLSRHPASLPGHGAAYLDLLITPKSPFLIGQRQVVSNLFVSNRIIPGGVIKGTLAAFWLAAFGKKGHSIVKADADPSRPDLCRNFSKLRFTHAFPAEHGANERPVTPPLSLVKCPMSSVYDVALCDGPGLIGQPPKAPSFAPDWKDAGDIDKMFGWGDPRHELRVHTEIENNRAKDGSLFAYEMIAPEGFEWHSRIDLHDVPDSERPAVEGQLRSLLGLGLRGFGKTHANASIEIVEAADLQAKEASRLAPVDGQSDQWIIVLQTPALLCDSHSLNETSGRKELFKCYSDAWEELSGGSLKLVRYFATQTLTGGKYLGGRFQRGRAYNPYLLTDAGSVFVLRSASNSQNAEDKRSAQEYIDKWYREGLPLPRRVSDRYRRPGRTDADLWLDCPYVPQNGYGEIAVNLRVHQDLAPGGAFHAISQSLVD